MLYSLTCKFTVPKNSHPQSLYVMFCTCCICVLHSLLHPELVLFSSSCCSFCDWLIEHWWVVHSPEATWFQWNYIFFLCIYRTHMAVFNFSPIIDYLRNTYQRMLKVAGAFKLLKPFPLQQPWFLSEAHLKIRNVQWKPINYIKLY